MPGGSSLEDPRAWDRGAGAPLSYFLTYACMLIPAAADHGATCTYVNLSSGSIRIYVMPYPHHDQSGSEFGSGAKSGSGYIAIDIAIYIYRYRYPATARDVCARAAPAAAARIRIVIRRRHESTHDRDRRIVHAYARARARRVFMTYALTVFPRGSIERAQASRSSCACRGPVTRRHHRRGCARVRDAANNPITSPPGLPASAAPCPRRLRLGCAAPPPPRLPRPPAAGSQQPARPQRQRRAARAPAPGPA